MALAQAIEAAGRRAAVINADSAQVYADLAVLSARPSQDDMGGIEHHLYGAWDGAVACSAADWANAAKQEIAAIHADGGVPVLVGGTGLYIRTLLDGIAPVPPIEEAIRAQVRRLPVAEAYAALQAEDPDRAARLAPADTTRVARALEVVRSTGRTLADWQADTQGGVAQAVTVRAAILLPEREWLYARCNARFAQMLESGAIPEVARLLERQLDPDLPVMRAIGVPEIAALLRGEVSEGEALARGTQATRNYAKRQFTWLRHQPPTEWPRLAFDASTATTIKATLLRCFGLT